ncbi:DEAD-box ATP-dependent RNA helicase 42 isoform X1 [Camellia sinensis]|uniref:DEAD-box ATP-dependent RNA helicase 42 isoform X1 n=1 Tax=Camellia sinensis TaxID=4442 RepID=UPI00103664D2|nr:DEAD-box ATP-dependent RNA helicase 42 isoform X1 [Camellia sinensis]
MPKDRKKSPEEKDPENGAPPKKDHTATKSKRKIEDDFESDDGSEEESKHSSRSKKKRSRSSKRRSRRKYSDDDSYSSSSEDDYSDSESESSDYSSEESEEERRRRRRKREEREKERKRRRREKEKKRRRKERDEDKKKKRKKKDKKKASDKGKKGAVTNSWGKYGIIKETDMWNKRPEFTAWLAEVKQVNLETLPNWEEKQMFKQFMEDHNTATFPSRKYYNLDADFKRKMEKEQKKGIKNVLQTERTVFNDEEQRRQEMLEVRERQKEKEVDALKRSMQSGMAQAMKEQAQLREEMAYQYKLGNFEVRMLFCLNAIIFCCGCNSKKIGPRCCYVRRFRLDIAHRDWQVLIADLHSNQASRYNLLNLFC